MRLIIHGRVQGVGYRDWLVHTAHLHRLHGWVRNLTDGAVEAVLAGPEATLMACLAACQKGPPMAKVSRIETLPYEQEVPPAFERKQTTTPSRQGQDKCL